MSTNEVRVSIYRGFIDKGRAPMPAEIAAQLDLQIDKVMEALEELHDADVIALAPGTHNVWLAHPFSALDAPFKVSSAAEQAWDAICIWDALGILGLLEADGSVATACPDCGEGLEIDVRDGEIAATNVGVVHYGVPANRWYEDVGFT